MQCFIQWQFLLSLVFLSKRIVLPEIIGAFAFVSSVAILFNMPNSVLRNGVGWLVSKYLGLDDKQFVYRVASLSLTFLIITSIFGAVLLGLCGIFFRKDDLDQRKQIRYEHRLVKNEIVLLQRKHSFRLWCLYTTYFCSSRWTELQQVSIGSK